MYLRHYKQKDGRVQLSITQSFRDSSGKSRNKTIKTFGYLDKVAKDWNMTQDQAFERCRQICDEMTKEYSENMSAETIEVNFFEKLSLKDQNCKNFGSCVCLAFYNQLNIETLLRNAVYRSKIEFDINAVMRLLVIERLFYPNSKLSAYQNKDNYFFRTKFSISNIYRALDIFSDNKDKIISCMNNSICKHEYRSSLDNVYYDVTNYYFECEENEMLKYGCSKEHRKNPIIQMGLLQDENAIPITYKLFAGNTNDCETMLDVLSDLKDRYQLKRVIVVADKGNNTSTNIALTVAKGDGFIFSQSIKGTKSKKQLRDWVLDEDGYTYNKDNTYKVKSKIDTKTIHLKAQYTNSGKDEKVDIEVKVVAFWSKKYQERSRAQRQDAIDKAIKMINTPSTYTTYTNHGAARFVKGIDYDKDTAEILDTDKVLEFDYKKLQDEIACDGYYCIITSETSLSDSEIIDAYSGLWQIEESFKITKSDLCTRPVYVRTQKHIEAHFLICYISLCISRMMQYKLKHKYSVRSIMDTLSKCSAYNAQKNIWLFAHKSRLQDELYELIGLKGQQKWMKLTQIKKWFSKTLLPK